MAQPQTAKQPEWSRMRLVVTLMVDYAIHDVKLWGAVLRQLQDQGEHRFLYYTHCQLSAGLRRSVGT